MRESSIGRTVGNLRPRFGGRIFRVETLDFSVVSGPHPFEISNERAIEENWAREKAANAALYDGSAMMPSSLIREGGQLRGTFHRTRFATVIYWLRNTDFVSCPHTYANAMLVTNDNALVAIEMGPHTYHSGSVYFPSGGFEDQDIADGKIDVWANMCREIREETGLAVDRLPRDTGFQVFSAPNGFVITVRVYLGMNATDAERRIRGFLKNESQPEIVRSVVIGNAAPPTLQLAPQMPALIDWHFRNLSRQHSASSREPAALARGLA